VLFALMAEVSARTRRVFYVAEVQSAGHNYLIPKLFSQSTYINLKMSRFFHMILKRAKRAVFETSAFFYNWLCSKGTEFPI